MKSGTKTLTLS